MEAMVSAKIKPDGLMCHKYIIHQFYSCLAGLVKDVELSLTLTPIYTILSYKDFKILQYQEEKMNTPKEICRRFFKRFGITLNGHIASDIQVNNESFYGHLLRTGSLGLGEAYMRGWWNCSKLDQFFERLFVNGFPH